MIISLDFETFFSKKLKYTIKRLGNEGYCRHALFDCYIASVSDGKTSWSGHPKDLNWSALNGATLISHNRGFDNSVFNELVRRGIIPKITPAAWHCSADMSAYLCNRRALSHVLQHLYDHKMSKEARDDSNNKHWPEDFSPAEQKTMLEYARMDAAWTHKLWTDHNHKWPDKERRLSQMTINQGMRGVQINTTLLDEYICQSHEMKLATEKLLPWLEDADDDDSWEDFNTKPTSTKCIAEQCRRAGIPCPPVKEHEGEEAYVEWEKTFSPRNPWISALSSWRSINKIYKSFLVVKERLRSDGTLPFSLKYFGAHTGRWSGDGGMNFQNMRKKPILCDRASLMESNEKKIDAAIKEKKVTGKYPDWVKYDLHFRHLVIPRPGRKMIVSDLSQIEPRCLAWLAGDKKLLAMVSGGMSIYEAFARTNMGFEGVMDKGSTFYAEVKAKVLALGYQAGWEKYIEMAADYTGMDITANDPEFIEIPEGRISGYGQKAKADVAEYRMQNKLVVDLWNNLDNMFKRSVGEKLQVVLPNGRVLRYEKVRCERRLKPDKDGKPKLKTVFTCDIGDRRFESYGGKLTENLTQGFGRDVFSEHLLTLNDTPGIDVLFSSHDEAITEVDENITAKQVQEIMSVCPEWCEGLPVAAEAKEVPHYLK